MSDHQAAIDARLGELGIAPARLASIRNFIAAAFYHVGLPGTQPADKHLAYDNAIRRATNRIACQGGYGSSRGKSRILSRRAITLREAILENPAIPPRDKYRRWLSEVTEEHQDPVAAVEAWITASHGAVREDDVVLRLLTHPTVIITREEERRIPSQFRWDGSPADRYAEADIEPVLVEEGGYAFFSRRLSPNRAPPRGK